MRRSTNGGMRLASMEKILAVTSQADAAAHRDSVRRAAVKRSPEDRADRERAWPIAAARSGSRRSGRTGSATSSSAAAETRGLPARSRPRWTARASASAEDARATCAARPAPRANAPKWRKSTRSMDRLKLYLMIGLPSETDEDIIDECVRFTTEIVPRDSGVARHRALRSCAESGTRRSTARRSRAYDLVHGPARTAYRRARLQNLAALRRALDERQVGVGRVHAGPGGGGGGGAAEGRAVVEAARDGAGFAAYKRAFARLAQAAPATRPRRTLAIAPV